MIDKEGENQYHRGYYAKNRERILASLKEERDTERAKRKQVVVFFGEEPRDEK